MVNSINNVLPPTKVLSIKCLLKTKDPLYARFDIKIGQLVTFEWMSVDSISVWSLANWKIVASLSYLFELKICKIWSTSTHMIHYNIHFRKGMPVLPLIIKCNNIPALQVDFISLRASKRQSFSKPFEQALYIGLRRSPINCQQQCDLEETLKNLLYHLADFFYALGNRHPIVLATERKTTEKTFYLKHEKYSIEYLSSYGNQNFRVIAYNPNNS